ncbi:DJ-1/PfpI family protein [Mycobacterium stomatepiae]|uniref:Glutamine amidotransferase n=1 Tax=Mycobacterium stomatepiae TaxID=470076 RepID=A0A7I7Q2Z4_9MYCO|nr:DJ-1/PfpI family protein [Mycobacterium stomatepiae]MCV7165327.1 DJ-1/PfpI family protein [Mycobacterium stomatepiae]BBY20422.1 glutamine amidotransferase [Mycobacterium stomatepiae]
MTQIAFVAYPGFTALDMIGPYEVLRNLPGAEVRFVWHETGPITADSGVLVIGATHSLAETPTPDLILVPGGPSTPVHARDEVLLDWLRRAHQSARWTASVCSGSVILAAAGLLEGRRATSHWLAIQLLKSFGAIGVSDERVVRQDNVITSAGVSAGLDLAFWLAGEIGGEGRAKAIQLAIEYDPQPPFDSGHLSKASATTKAAAAALLSRDSAKPANLMATTMIAWDQALSAVRSRRRKRQPDLSAVSAKA